MKNEINVSINNLTKGAEFWIWCLYDHHYNWGTSFMELWQDYLNGMLL